MVGRIRAKIEGVEGKILEKIEGVEGRIRAKIEGVEGIELSFKKDRNRER